ncbi:MAG: LON peptidase substrate-binding domain-containing protein [Betaproteobacteria bacterium]|nr:LON peptidase substrate-binding domain-containing protein [Betaproteobacteria bacterium]MCL2885225.1 LON peptidase substrate-binding domain-containing protein [Betaproteobacteria bacterium]
MGWFDFTRAAGAAVETLRLPLFPLNAVLFPGSLMTLKVFEQRYLDMTADCMKQDKPFGICLIASGGETGSAAVPHPVGTLASIATWEMEQLGILLIGVKGGRRFRIIESHVGPANLLEATVELLPEPPPLPPPPERQRLLPLLQRIVKDIGPKRIPEPHRFDDAAWVGYRITEVLPIQNLARQKLLELDDPLARLEILEIYLDQHKLLG